MSLRELKADLGIDDDRDDVVLVRQLDAAMTFVQRLRPGFDYDGAGELPAVPGDLALGTVRLAGRWFTRRRSPDALVALGELGSSRVPSFDPDVERLLKIGRYRSPVIA
ncbi:MULTISPECIES: phage head-tail connector protein [unclassified Pseudonocardia]|uniref:phage head-tail connector protein n=1 Tax=unclassified Pseudonocardia TaxID=2619320 RepID=UPI0014826290|nr:MULTISPECIES: phage head-tail connector protein [unclassified Pseudonocardia]